MGNQEKQRSSENYLREKKEVVRRRKERGHGKTTKVRKGSKKKKIERNAGKGR